MVEPFRCCHQSVGMARARGGGLFLFSYLYILRTLAVSIAFPVIVGLGTAGVLLAGVSFFGESLKPHSLIGVAAILGGVVLLSQ